MPKKKENYAGIHILAEFWEVKKIEDEGEIKRMLFEAAKEAKNTPIKAMVKKFLPQGMTGIILLAESHIAIHTWPERNYAAIDIFTCGSHTLPEKALDYLRMKFNPRKTEVKTIKRGRY